VDNFIASQGMINVAKGHIQMWKENTLKQVACERWREFNVPAGAVSLTPQEYRTADQKSLSPAEKPEE
jgi:hypothetical protein